jgi:hypothetical protein
MSTDYEDIAGGGTFAKFDDKGDKVEGTVIACGLEAATDFDNNPCPGIDIDTADGIVTVTCSNASLKRKATTAITQGKLTRGAKVLVELVGFYETNKGSKGKDFRLAVAPAPLVDIDDTAGF